MAVCRNTRIYIANRRLSCKAFSKLDTLTFVSNDASVAIVKKRHFIVLTNFIGCLM